MMQVEAKRKCVFAGIRPFLFGEFGASPRCKFPVKCVLPGYILHLYRQNQDCVGAVRVAVEGMQRRWSVGSKNTEP